MKKKTVVLLSGGVDSTTLAYYAEENGHDIYPLAIDYGQRHIKEIEAADRIANQMKKVLKIVEIPFDIFQGSSLTDETIKVPEGHYEAETMKTTVVPNRNMVFLSLATAYAMSIQANTVAYAAHGGDHAIYADCRPKFVNSMVKAINLSSGGEIELYTPFIQLTKKDIVTIGLNSNLNVPYELTWSCYKGEEFHCGVCGTCIERREAFQLNGSPDFVKYQ